MAKNARGRDGAVLDFFDVGGTDAAGGDADEEFAGADAGDGDGFEAEIVCAAIDDGTHGFGDVGHRGILTTKNTKDTKFHPHIIMDGAGRILTTDGHGERPGTNLNRQGAKDAKAEYIRDGVMRFARHIS